MVCKTFDKQGIEYSVPATGCSLASGWNAGRLTGNARFPDVDINVGEVTVKGEQ